MAADLVPKIESVFRIEIKLTLDIRSTGDVIRLQGWKGKDSESGHSLPADLQ